ncbi:hypothetical protein C8Q75DRAFT_448834 [Abortiporus biennis]|nr:hypothetical protein C8Q75DRAFT_448834 [Abortiporus biennis]
MTSTDDVPVYQLYLHNYLHLLGVSILYYDYVITFSDEVSYVWFKPKSGAAWLFLLNRYFSLFADVGVNIGNFFPFKSELPCRRYSLYRTIVIVGAQVIVAVIMFLRTYALYGQTRSILYLMLSVGFILLGLSVWGVTKQQSMISVGYLGCHLVESIQMGIRTAIAWESLFAYDTMIFILTLLKTFRQRRRFKGLASSPHYHRHAFGNLADLVFRDGAMYFGVMACANFANTMTFYGALKGVLSTFASSISVTMINRVMLNLRKIAVSSSSSLPSSSPSNPAHDYHHNHNRNPRERPEGQSVSGSGSTPSNWTAHSNSTETRTQSTLSDTLFFTSRIEMPSRLNYTFGEESEIHEDKGEEETGKSPCGEEEVMELDVLSMRQSHDSQGKDGYGHGYERE